MNLVGGSPSLFGRATLINIPSWLSGFCKSPVPSFTGDSRVL